MKSDGKEKRTCEGKERKKWRRGRHCGLERGEGRLKVTDLNQ